MSLDDIDLSFDFSKKKKKRSSKPSLPSSSTDKIVLSGVSDVSVPDYNYEELIDRVYSLMSKNTSTDKIEKDRQIHIPAPLVYKDGTKRIVWSNFEPTCTSMNRSLDHVREYVINELGVSGSLDAEKRLCIRGRFQPTQIQAVIRHYVREYVMCNMCKKTHTELSKENRLFFMICKECGAKRSVSDIKKGFVAQVGKRKNNV